MAQRNQILSLLRSHDPGQPSDLKNVSFGDTSVLNQLQRLGQHRHECLRASGPRADGHGASVTFVGSTAGRFGERGHVDYAASKAGLVGAMSSLKNEIVQLDPYARVNVVEPGWTVTHMARAAIEEPGAVERVTRTMALRQLGRAKDIARLIAVLASPTASSHVSGQVITVAGGMEGRLLWNEDDVDRDAVLARLDRD